MNPADYAEPLQSLIAPARNAVEVTPSDTADLAEIPKALWVSVAGTVSIVPLKGDAGSPVALGSLLAGQVIPIRARRVMDTGTTATIIALY